jgi:transposase-like protein
LLVGEYEARHRRNFSEEFKRSKVKEIVAKKLKVSDLCKLYSVNSIAVYGVATLLITVSMASFTISF